MRTADPKGEQPTRNKTLKTNNKQPTRNKTLKTNNKQPTKHRKLRANTKQTALNTLEDKLNIQLNAQLNKSGFSIISESVMGLQCFCLFKLKVT